MPHLSCGYSNALAELIRENAAPIDAIEFTPYNRLHEIRSLLPQLIAYRPYFHPGSMLRWIPQNRQITEDLLSYLEIIKPPFVSFHIVQKSGWAVFLARFFNYARPASPKKDRVQAFINQVKDVQTLVHMPVILENMPASAFNDRIEADPTVINQVITETGCDFLLDIPHARISAAMLGMQPRAYLEQLPLQRTRQLHISGPRIIRGKWYDAHEPIEQEDLDLLKWCLDHTNPEVVTLEYHKEKAALARQLEQIYRILHG